MVHIFHLLQTGMVFENVNPFSWIFNAISREKSCLISMPFLTCLLDVRTLELFPPARSWLVNSNFPRASRMQGSNRPFHELPSAVCCPNTDHVIFSRELFFYPSKSYLFICTRLFVNLKGRILKNILMVWNGTTDRPVEKGHKIWTEKPGQHIAHNACRARFSWCARIWQPYLFRNCGLTERRLSPIYSWKKFVKASFRGT